MNGPITKITMTAAVTFFALRDVVDNLSECIRCTIAEPSSSVRGTLFSSAGGSMPALRNMCHFPLWVDSASSALRAANIRPRVDGATCGLPGWMTPVPSISAIELPRSRVTR